LNLPRPATPDDHSLGLLDDAVEALRYDQPDRSRYEVAARVAAMIPSGARVLDVGCGSGCVTEVIAERCQVELLALEPDGERASRARERGLSVEQAYLTEGFFEAEGQFDVILLIDVLEHLPAPGAFLQLVRSGLRPGGCVIASIPNVAHWSVRRQLARGEFHYERTGIMDATHLRWFTRSSAQRLFERMGFQVERVDWTLGLQMHCYWNCVPYRWMRPKVRKALARAMVAVLPNAFACQNILLARTSSRGA